MSVVEAGATAHSYTVGLHLIQLLEKHGVDTVFGIPGVHTAELYRGLATSPIRHVTPRHEADAGFMADGYARVSGKPGVCLLITGPGVTNAITAMAQARADSIPMLVISGVNARETQGQYRGYLHELPDQAATLRTIALSSERLEQPDDLAAIVTRAFAGMLAGRPGPVHIEIPVDLMEAPAASFSAGDSGTPPTREIDAQLHAAAQRCTGSQRPLVLAGGGAAWAEDAVRLLAERLDAPVVTTTNARGIMSGHPLCVPASPSLPAVRRLIADADLVIAIGTEFGPTDYDAYADGGFIAPTNIVRIDIDPEPEKTSIAAQVSICAEASIATMRLVQLLGDTERDHGGAGRAETARRAALASLSPKMRAMIDVLGVIRDMLPGCVMVGDSTQLVYAGNLYWEAAAPRSWFNSSTGYGSLGYAAPASVGASIANRDVPVVCLIGDGGFQFCLGALGAAADEAARVIFIVWNNYGYQEIEDYMIARGIEPVGVRPTAPDFTLIAAAYNIPAERIRLTEARHQSALAPGKLDLDRLANALSVARNVNGPALIEILTP